ncbi:FMN-binding protein [Candidatus Pseudoruminococcus sp.]|uniref:FMN-binding protein n=1 Tax=Candidatus Pseudoruminococcus sp. TaxID=3101048 RepID=UPI00399B305F
MLLIISLVLAVAFVFLCGKALKKHPNLFYIGAGIITAVLALIPFDGVPDFVNNYILALFRRGSLATAIFIIVMYTGALKNGSAIMKKLIVIRGELSIMASIMILCHNIFFGKTYFVRLFTSASTMPVTQLLAAIASLLMLVIMIPLAIMSFPKVRKKMKPKLWKKLQRFAYAFYALIYIHIFLLTYSSAQARRGDYALSLILYTIVFGVYLVMRVRKYLLKKNSNIKLALNAGSGVCAAGIVGAVCLFVFLGNGNTATPARTPVRTFAYSAESSAATADNSNSESQLPVETSEVSQTSETTSTENKEESKSTTSESSKTSSKVESKSTKRETSKSNSQSSQVATKSSNTSNNNNTQNSKPSTSNNNNSSSSKNNTSSKPSTSKPSQSTNKPSNSGNTVSKPEKSAQETSKAPVVQNKYKDGKFSGSAYGYDGNIYVTITIKDDKITNIEATSDESDPWYFESCVQNVTSQIISNQSTNVDATSGATYSSEGIMAAVEQALNSAKN